MPVESTPLMKGEAAGSSTERSDSTMRAAWYIEDATLGFAPRNIVESSTELLSKRDAMLLSSYVRAYLMMPTLAGLVLIMLFELPLWCGAASLDKWAFDDPLSMCVPADPYSQVYLSGLSYLPPMVGVLCELACYGLLLLIVGLDVRWRGALGCMRERPALVAIAALTLIATLDTLVYASAWQPRRVAPFCRLAIVALTEPLRSTFASTAEALPSFVRILAIHVGIYMFMGFVLATMLFGSGDDSYPPHCGNASEALAAECPQVGEGFRNIGDAFFSMIFLAAGQNMPNAILPMYSTHRIYGVVWLGLFVLINFVMLNVVLATVFNAYQASFKRRVVLRFTNRAIGLANAFDELVEERNVLIKSTTSKRLLDEMQLGKVDKTGVAKPQFLRLVQELNRSATVKYVPRGQIDYLYATLDDDGDGVLDKDEFVDLADVLNFSYTRVRTQSYVERTYPAVWASLHLEQVKAWTTSPSWYGLPALMTVVMLVNCVTVVVQAEVQQYHVEAFSSQAASMFFAYTYYYLSLFYLVELVLLCTTQSWSKYFVEGGRLIDFTISVVVSVISVLWIYPYIYIPNVYLKYANLVRVLKLVKLLTLISPNFAFVITTLAAIFRGAINVIGQLFVWTGFFVAFGNQAFGGAIYHTQPLIEDTAYQAALYEVLNFNDFFLGFVPFFATLCSAGPNHDLILGIGEAVENTPLASVFFFAYYYSTQLLVLNILVAFIVSAYTLRSEMHAESKNEDELGLDTTQSKNLESLYSNLPDEPGWQVQASASENQDVLLRRMFGDEIAKATENLPELQRRASNE